MPTDSYEIIVADDNGKEVGGARNNGIALAKGEYLLFVDADDYLFENSLLPLFEMLMKEQPDILTFDYRRVANNESLHLIQKTGEEIYQTGALYMCRHNFLGTVWHHFYKRELFIKHQLQFDHNAFHEDEAIVVQAYFYAQKTIISNRIAYAYVQHKSSILNSGGYDQRMKRLNGFTDVCVMCNLSTFSKK